MLKYNESCFRTIIQGEIEKIETRGNKGWVENKNVSLEKGKGEVGNQLFASLFTIRAVGDVKKGKKSKKQLSSHFEFTNQSSKGDN